MTVASIVCAWLLAGLLLTSVYARVHYRRNTQAERETGQAYRLGHAAGRADYHEHRGCPPEIHQIPAFDSHLPGRRRARALDVCCDFAFDLGRYQGWCAAAQHDLEQILDSSRAVA
jgi:hypothetical protein